MKRAKQKRVTPPRNPLVALVLFKKFGAHSKTEKALRREAQVAIRQKLNRGE